MATTLTGEGERVTGEEGENGGVLADVDSGCVAKGTLVLTVATTLTGGEERVENGGVLLAASNIDLATRL